MGKKEQQLKRALVKQYGSVEGVYRRDCQRCCFLASDESGYVARVELFVDGGAFEI